MQGSRQRELLKYIAHLRKICNQFFQDWLGRFAVRTLQIAELNHGDHRRLRSFAWTICNVQFGACGRERIRAERNHAANDGVASIRRDIDMSGRLLVDRDHDFRHAGNNRWLDLINLPANRRVVTESTFQGCVNLVFAGQRSIRQRQLIRAVLFRFRTLSQGECE